MNEFQIIKNEEVTDELLDKVLEFDRTIFPEDDEYAFPDGYFRKLYKDNKEGMFVLLVNNNVIGYVNLIFITDENKEEFLKTRNYLNLEQTSFDIGDNNVYLYNLLVKEEYRDGIAIKYIMKEICMWLDECIKQGKNIKYFFSEAVSEDGIKTLKAMDLKAQDVDELELGIYYSDDNLISYISKMLKKS